MRFCVAGQSESFSVSPFMFSSRVALLFFIKHFLHLLPIHLFCVFGLFVKSPELCYDVLGMNTVDQRSDNRSIGRP